jgi:hypothetical protein
MRNLTDYNDQWWIDNGFLTKKWDTQSYYWIIAMTPKLRAVVDTIFRERGVKEIITISDIMDKIENFDIDEIIATEKKLKAKAQHRKEIIRDLDDTPTLPIKRVNRNRKTEYDKVRKLRPEGYLTVKERKVIEDKKREEKRLRKLNANNGIK